MSRMLIHKKDSPFYSKAQLTLRFYEIPPGPLVSKRGTALLDLEPTAE